MVCVGAWVVSTTSLTCTEYLAVKPKLPSKVGQWHGTCTGTPYNFPTKRDPPNLTAPNTAPIPLHDWIARQKRSTQAATWPIGVKNFQGNGTKPWLLTTGGLKPACFRTTRRLVSRQKGCEAPCRRSGSGRAQGSRTSAEPRLIREPCPVHSCELCDPFLPRGLCWPRRGCVNCLLQDRPLLLGT